jgi:D-alanyl-D-alanine carboxypeptidase
MTRQELLQPPAHNAHSAPARHTGRRTSRRPMAYAVVAAATLTVVFGVYPLLDQADSPVVQALDALSSGSAGAGSTGVAGGDVLGGQATLDDDIPAITQLDPELASAVRQAADAAAADGVDFWITSGWRSPAFQQYLLDQAVQEYGSLEEARRWVNTPEKSTHVTGKAVDVGPATADYWLIQHGAEHGLCQVYANEIWHFELLTDPGGTCPPLVEDSSAG